MIEVHLYGRLRQYAPDSRASGESVVQLQPQSDETVATVLRRLGIAPDEVYHIFLNGGILATRNSMAPWLAYQQATSHADVTSATGEALQTRVRDGDRVGLFARDMALLVV